MTPSAERFETELRLAFTRCSGRVVLETLPPTADFPTVARAVWLLAQAAGAPDFWDHLKTVDGTRLLARATEVLLGSSWMESGRSAFSLAGEVSMLLPTW